jgi:hypothetical protein
MHQETNASAATARAGFDTAARAHALEDGVDERHSLLRAPSITGGDLQPASAAAGAAGKGGGT